MCCDQPGKYVQCCCVFLPGLLGMSLTLFLGCFVPGADIRVALIVYLVVINVITFFFYMIDKGIAAGSTDMGGDHWRIAEFALLLLIFLGGSFGAWLGMIFCFHKIHKQSFICCAVPVTIFSLTWVFLWLILTAEDNLSKCYKYQKGIGDATR